MGAAGDGQLAELARRQDGVVSLDQLRELGTSPRASSYRAEQARLHRVHRATYAVGHRSIGELGRLRAALLACGSGALISHLSAAALLGIRDRSPRLVDVLVPNQRGRKIDGVRCRRCRYPDPSEIAAESGISCSTPARTLVDLAGLLGTDSLRRAVERAAVLKLLNLAAIDASMELARRRRGISALRGIVDEWRTDDGEIPDLRSDFEALALPRLIAIGLPRPVCNQAVRHGEGALVVDFLWPEQRVVVETDGRQTHHTPIAFEHDRRRDQLLVAAGYRVIRATWHQIHDELDAVVSSIAQTLRSQA